MSKAKLKKASAHKVRVALGRRSYDVVIGSGIASSFAKTYKSDSKRAILISDESLIEHRAKVIGSLKAAGWNVHEIAVRAGESLKDFENIYPIYGELLKVGIDRSSTLFALGGGTIGDAAGFIASTYLRGIKWVGLPTTLLAQVDSSIGGKTAVNHAQGKNLVGTFHQPSLVVCDTDFLRTLPRREVISGLGEALKYGITFDAKFFDYQKKNWDAAVALDPEVINQIVKASVSWKAKTVAKDEFDKSGVREVLNFGHTFAHALEKLTDYKGHQHGEAVLWGMRFALALSKEKKKLTEKNWEKTDSFLRSIPLPGLPQGLEPSQFFAPMKKDKKAKDGKVRFVLLKSLGKTVLDRDITQSDLEKALQTIIQFKQEKPRG